MASAEEDGMSDEFGIFNDEGKIDGGFYSAGEAEAKVAEIEAAIAGRR